MAFVYSCRRRTRSQHTGPISYGTPREVHVLWCTNGVDLAGYSVHHRAVDAYDTGCSNERGTRDGGGRQGARRRHAARDRNDAREQSRTSQGDKGHIVLKVMGYVYVR